MKKIKKITSLLLFVVILFSMTVISVSASTTVDNFQIEYDSATSGYVVEKYLGNENNVVIPDKFYGKYVTKIGRYAFAKNTTVESVQLPDLLTHIDEYAFSDCTSLKDITIPPFVVAIGKYAFFGCTSLKSVTTNCKITAINESVFHNCTSLESFTVPSKVKKISSNAFANCKNLTNMRIYDTVNLISTDAFSGCGDSLNIVATDGSYAQQFAKDNNIKYVDPDDPGEPDVPVIMGDVNNDGIINVRDCAYIQKYLILKPGYEIPEGSLAFKRADVNLDGSIDVIDATLIQKYAMRMIDKF